MKKASKILTIILVVVLLCGVFSGCAMFGKDVVKYRNATAIKVGNQEISVGKVLDTFNSYYNQYSSYISAGYGITLESILEMAMSSLYTQYVKVDDYVANHDAINHDLAEFCANAQYLTKDEMQFAISYIKYLSFQTFDSDIEERIEAKYELKAAETEDTSRDFLEYDDLQGATSYSEYTLQSNFRNEDMTEYFTKYYAGSTFATDAKLDGYVFENEAAAKARLDELNARIEGEDKITFADYQDMQKKVLTQYDRSIDNAYGITMEQFVINQVADMVLSAIVAKYNYEVYNVIEGDGLADAIATLNKNYQILKGAQENEFAINDSFVTTIESLSSSSTIYTVPAEYANSYIFVKNLLIPFSASQTAKLTNLKKQIPETDDRYIEYRTKLAAEIVADDFLSEKNDDGEYAKVENIFAMDGDKLVINSTGALATYFSNGVVTAMDGKTKDETFVELMKQYNTDTAQHSAKYEYVVRVGATPDSYTAKWVTEFVDGANEAHKLGEKSYALAVSEYGVHIIYYSANVVAQQFDFTANRLDTTKPEYEVFKTYFNAQQNLLLTKDSEDLYHNYVEANKITKTKAFDNFLKDNELEFDFDASLEHDHE